MVKYIRFDLQIRVLGVLENIMQIQLARISWK